MNIALDYDDTFTRDPPLWRDFVLSAKGHGHDIRFVTFRNPGANNEDILASSEELDIPIIFTAAQPKRAYCYRLGFMVHVWIDDMPEIIVEDHPSVPRNLINLALETN